MEILDEINKKLEVINEIRPFEGIYLYRS